MRDMGKIKNNNDKPESLKKGKLTETTGTCKYCKNLVAIKAAPDATEEEKNKIASAECSCQDGKDARDIEVSVRVLTEKINDRYIGLPEDARKALISCLKPVAYGKLEKITVKVDDATTIKIYRSSKGLNLKRTIKEDDIMDEWSPN